MQLQAQQGRLTIKPHVARLVVEFRGRAALPLRQHLHVPIAWRRDTTLRLDRAAAVAIVEGRD